MALAALVVSIISALFGGAAIVYYRRSAQAAERSATDSSRSAAAAERSAEAATRSADAAAVTAKLDTDRRHAELTPRFRITVEPSNPGSDTLRLAVCLLGPPELERLDALTVTIRDDHPWRARGTPLAAGPSPEEVAAQIWGRWRFTPGTGPGTDSIKGIPGADSTGRTTPTGGLPVGEELPFQLEPTYPPRWSAWDLDGWRRTIGSLLRLRLECHRNGWAPWILPCEMKIDDGAGHATLPPDNFAQDELASTQRAALQAAQQRSEGEQAQSVTVTWDDLPSQPGRSLVVVINDSKRPIFGVVVRGQVVQNAVSLLPALNAGEMYPSAIPAGEATPDPWTYRGGTPGDRLESLRPGGHAGFECGFPHTAWPHGRSFVRFTDAAGLHWQLDQEHHLERLNERGW